MAEYINLVISDKAKALIAAKEAEEQAQPADNSHNALRRATKPVEAGEMQNTVDTTARPKRLKTRKS